MRNDIMKLRGFFPPSFKEKEQHNGYVYYSYDMTDLKPNPKNEHMELAWKQLDAFITCCLTDTKIDWLGDFKKCFRFNKKTGALVFFPGTKISAVENEPRKFVKYANTFIELCAKYGLPDLQAEISIAANLLEMQDFDSFTGNYLWNDNDCEDLGLDIMAPPPIGKIAEESELNSIPDEPIRPRHTMTFVKREREEEEEEVSEEPRLKKHHDLDILSEALHQALAEVNELQTRRTNFTTARDRWAAAKLQQEELAGRFAQDYTNRELLQQLTANLTQLQELENLKNQFQAEVPTQEAVDALYSRLMNRIK